MDFLNSAFVACGNTHFINSSNYGTIVPTTPGLILIIAENALALDSMMEKYLLFVKIYSFGFSILILSIDYFFTS